MGNATNGDRGSGARLRRSRLWALWACLRRHAALVLLAAGSAASAQVTVVPTETDTTSITVNQRSLSQVLLFQVATPASGAALKVRVESFRGPDGQAGNLKLGAGGTAMFEQPDAGVDGQPVPLKIEADLDRIGEYAGRLIIQHGKSSATVRGLKVTRAVPKLPVSSLATMRGTADSFAWREATLIATLQGPLDREISATPSIASLVRQVTGQEPVQAAAAASATAFSPTVVTLKPSQVSPLTITFKDFDSPGEHRGKLVLSSSDQEPVLVDLVVIIRDPWWLATIFILAGSLASMVIRRWNSERRPRIVFREQVAILRRQVEELSFGDVEPNEGEAALLDGWKRDLDQLTSSLQRDGKLADADSASIEQKLEALRGKLRVFPSWASARRQIATLKAEDAKPLATTLDDISKAMPGLTQLGEDKLKTLAGLPTDIDRLRASLQQQEIASLESLAQDMSKSSDQDAALQAQWQQVMSTVAQTKKLVADGNFATARASQDQARALVATALVSDLQVKLGLQSPPGVKNWAELKAKVEVQLNAAKQALANDTSAALARHAEAYATYLNGVMAPLLNEVSPAGGLTAALERAAPEKQDELKAVAASSEALLKQAKIKLDTGDMGGAWTDYRKAFNDWAEARTPGQGFRMGDADERKMAMVRGATVPPVGPLPLRAAGWRVGPLNDTPEGLARERRTVDRVIDAVALVVATLLGLVFVWNANPIWGGPIDWALAVLWGLGLHQVSGYSFEGALGLRDKLK